MNRSITLLLLPLAAVLFFPSSAARSDPADATRAARAAHGAGEPSLQEILDRLGYSVDTNEEIPAQRFVKAGRGKVTTMPVAAFGLPKVCTGGWYRPREENSREGKPEDKPEGRILWRIAPGNNKQLSPPVEPGSRTSFDPGRKPFGLWVSTAGFVGETIYTEDALQRFDPRFAASDRHKAHVFPASRNGQLIPNTYIIGWEYSTNDDDQDVMTLVKNVRPVE